MASVVVTVKVAMVSASGDPFAPAVGPDCCTADLCAALTRAGHEVTVYVRRRLADGCPSRVHVYRGGRSVVVERISVGPDEPLPLEDRPGLIAGFGDRLAEAWERRPPDVVHAHFWTAGLAAFAGAQGIRLPVVLTLHGAAVVDRRLHGTGERLATRCRLESALADKVDHVITTCDEETLGLVRQGVRRPRARRPAAG